MLGRDFDERERKKKKKMNEICGEEATCVYEDHVNGPRDGKK